jgi:hypothetical protein
LINTENARTSELIGVRMVISNATLNRDKWDEKELATALKEIEHLRHLDEYYKGTTQTMVYLRSKFETTYNKFTHKRHMFTVKIAELQEYTLMVLATCKDME